MLTVPGILSGITVLLPIGAGPDEPPGDVVAPVHEALFTTRATRDHRAAVTGTDNTDEVVAAFTITDSKGTVVNFDGLTVKSVGLAAANASETGKQLAAHINSKVGETGVYLLLAVEPPPDRSTGALR